MIVYKELASLEYDLGFPLKTLFAVSNNIARHYKRVTIPKRSDGLRELSVPDEIRKKIQRKIADVLLTPMEISRYATAYHFGASVKRNALPHVGSAKILRLDIKHFFDSITYSSVKEKCFPAERFSEPCRILLTMLCYHGDALPQGAPTSPVVTNIIMKDFDETVGAFCEERGISYTRYSDDMTFSGEFNASEVIAFVKGELFKTGFVLNSEKTKLLTKANRQTVTGVVVNAKPAAPRAYRREIRREMHYIELYGIDSHLDRIASRVDKAKYLRKLLGRINFVLSISPDNNEFCRYRAKILSITKALPK